MPMENMYLNLPDREVSLFVRIRKGRKTTKNPIVLLHGWPASSRGWEAVTEAMADDRTVICPDLRGLGQSERTGTIEYFTKHELAKDIVALVDELGIQEFIVGGQDWGGTVAQEIALLRPQQVKALIIMNINLINNLTGNLIGFKTQMMSPKNPRWYMAFQSQPNLAEAMIPGSENLWVRYFFENGKGKDVAINETILAGYVEDYSRKGTAHCGANYYRAMAIDVERWATLSSTKFSQQSLIIYGNQDPFLVPEFYTEFESCFENVIRVDLPSGHFVHDEQPGKVAAEIEAFLENVG